MPVRLTRLLLASALVYGLSAPFQSAPQQSMTRQIEADGNRYPYLLEFPDNPDVQPPLVIALHGYGGDVGEFRAESELYRLTFEGYAVLFVQGLLDDRGVTHWNAGMTLSDRDDNAALVEIILEIQSRYRYDPARTFVIGFSNGGFMAYALACRSEGVVTGIVSVGGSVSGADWRDCPNLGRVPVLHVVGTADDVVPPDGSMSVEDGWGGAPPARDIVASWAEAAGAVAERRERVLGKVDVVRHVAQGGRVLAELALVDGLGHEWPSRRYAGIDVLPLITDFLTQSAR